jgi:hypothetical protein
MDAEAPSSCRCHVTSLHVNHGTGFGFPNCPDLVGGTPCGGALPSDDNEAWETLMLNAGYVLLTCTGSTLALGGSFSKTLLYCWCGTSSPCWSMSSGERSVCACRAAS